MSMDFLDSILSRTVEAQQEFEKLAEKKIYSERVLKVDPLDIANWEYRDRQNFELGNIEDLADSIELKGQAQPIILVNACEVFKAAEQSNCKYIVIAGYRRWLACKSRKIMVEAIVRNMNLEQAVACLVSENEKEKVSDYSKGMFYHNLLQQNKISKKILFEKLGIKRGVFDNYISFAEVPKEIWLAVGDLSKVSAKTSYIIKLLCQKGGNYQKALISIADKIREGIGERKIHSLVDTELTKLDKKKLPNATRVAFSNSIIMDCKKNQIRLGLKNISDKNVEILKIKISEILEQFIQETN